MQIVRPIFQEDQNLYFKINSTIYGINAKVFVNLLTTISGNPKNEVNYSGCNFTLNLSQKEIHVECSETSLSPINNFESLLEIKKAFPIITFEKGKVVINGHNLGRLDRFYFERILKLKYPQFKYNDLCITYLDRLNEFVITKPDVKLVSFNAEQYPTICSNYEFLQC